MDMNSTMWLCSYSNLPFKSSSALSPRTVNTLIQAPSAYGTTALENRMGFGLYKGLG